MAKLDVSTLGFATLGFGTLERHADHWRWIGGPVPPGAAAITIGPVISLRRHVAGNRRLLHHELVHVAQWRRLGLVGFLVAYLGAYLRWRLLGHEHWDAYRRIPLEVEAAWRARGATDPPLPVLRDISAPVT